MLEAGAEITSGSSSTTAPSGGVREATAPAGAASPTRATDRLLESCRTGGIKDTSTVLQQEPLRTFLREALTFANDPFSLREETPRNLKADRHAVFVLEGASKGRLKWLKPENLRKIHHAEYVVPGATNFSNVHPRIWDLHTRVFAASIISAVETAVSLFSPEDSVLPGRTTASVRRGAVKQFVAAWCVGWIPFDELEKVVAEI